MHVHLVAPWSEDSAYIKPLWAAVLAAHTPADVELTFQDGAIAPVDVEHLKVADLVGISVNTKTAAEAYRIADAYRAAATKVVLGGVHVAACPQEASRHADAIVVGEAEGLWGDIVRDAGHGCLRRQYQHAGWIDLAGLPLPRRELFSSPKYIPFDVVQTARGCPFPCEFCSVSTYHGPRFRFRPVREAAHLLVVIHCATLRSGQGPRLDPEPGALAAQPDAARDREAQDRGWPSDLAS